MKRIFLLLVLLSLNRAYAQPGAGFDAAYHLLNSGNITSDKNFYLLTTIRYSPEVSAILKGDAILARIYCSRASLMQAHIKDTCNHPNSLLDGLGYSANDSLLVCSTIGRLYDAHVTAFNQMINTHLRPSGCYQLFADLDNKNFLLAVWGQVMTGTNYIIDQYGFGKKLRYPAIDSATYFVHSRSYREMLKEMFAWQSERATDSLFFSPSQEIALKLMDINNRDEPARHEPLQNGLNKAAYKKIKHTRWNRYPYSALLLLGSGPEIPSIALSPTGKMRCDIAAEQYNRGLAPFIIVSGGYVTPFRTPYCEAIEMKKYLMLQYDIPESALITEPFARHTTTNIRNANRLIMRYGIPADKPVLIVSSVSHIGSITDTGLGFDRRNMRELGYLPYLKMTRTGAHEASYIPELNSLQQDPTDPLDP